MENFINSEIGLTHVVSASVALVVGTLVLTVKKGTKFHKRIGYVYVTAMLLVNATAFGIYQLFGTLGMFHFFATLSLLAILTGMLPLLFKWQNGLRFHISQMYFSVIGLYAAFFAETAVRVPEAVKTWTGFWFVVIGATILTFVLGIVVFVKKYKYWTPTTNLSGVTKIAAVCILMIMSFTDTQAQKSSVQVGYQISNLAGDFGNGIQVGWMSKSEHFGIKLNAEQNWLKGLEMNESQLRETFYGYQTARLAFEGSGYLSENIRIYGGGGPMIGFVNKIASQNVVLSGFGFWGFGFRANHSEYFLEMGGSGGFENAEKLINQPIIGTGFYLSIGQRFQFGG